MAGRQLLSLLLAIGVLSTTLHCSCMAAANTGGPLPACCQKHSHSTMPSHSSAPCPHCSGGMALEHQVSPVDAAIASDMTFVALPQFRSELDESIVSVAQSPRSQSPPRSDLATLLTLHSLLIV